MYFYKKFVDKILLISQQIVLELWLTEYTNTQTRAMEFSEGAS